MRESIILSGNADLNGCRDDKIQLVSCSHDCRKCRLVLVDINRLFKESEHFQSSKEYHLSIVSLKKAFEKTFEIKDLIEQECARVFRSTIVESLENIRYELKLMTHGIFSKRRYKESYLLAEATLEEFRKEKPAGNRRAIHDFSAFQVYNQLNQPVV